MKRRRWRSLNTLHLVRMLWALKFVQHPRNDGINLQMPQISALFEIYKSRTSYMSTYSNLLLKIWQLVRVRFAGFGKEEDEWVSVTKAVRERSIPLEHSECDKVNVGDLVLCFRVPPCFSLLTAIPLSYATHPRYANFSSPLIARNLMIMHSTAMHMLPKSRGRCMTAAAARVFLQFVGSTTILRSKYFLCSWVILF